MGIQINGQTDTISASDGGLAVSGYELTGASNINVTGIITTSQLNVGTGGTVITTTSDGKIGINSTSPSAETMDIVGNAPKINIDSTNGLSGFRLNIIQSSGQLFRVQNAGTTAFEVNSNGNTLLANGNLVFSTSGTGIDFSANTAAGTGTTTSSVLDDYEEGSWTPAYTPTSGSITPFYNNGKYTKIGNLVMVTGTLSNNGSSSPSGTIEITGLPFSISAPGASWGLRGGHGTVWAGYNFPKDQTNIVAVPTAGAYIYDDAGNYLHASELTYGYNEGQCSFTLTYITT